MATKKKNHPIRITDGPDLGRKPKARAEILKKPAKKSKRANADVEHYRHRLGEVQQLLDKTRNEVLALEALERTLVNRLDELQGHR